MTKNQVTRLCATLKLHKGMTLENDSYFVEVGSLELVDGVPVKSVHINGQLVGKVPMTDYMNEVDVLLEEMKDEVRDMSKGVL